jgi:hypothetical protein
MVKAIFKRKFDVHNNFEEGEKPVTRPTLLLRFQTLHKHNGHSHLSKPMLNFRVYVNFNPCATIQAI